MNNRLFKELTALLIMFGLSFGWCGCSGGTPKGQQTPEATAAKLCRAVLQKDKKAYVECYINKRYAEAEFEARESSWELMGLIEERYGAGTWEQFRAAPGATPLSFDPVSPNDADWEAAVRYGVEVAITRKGEAWYIDPDIWWVKVEPVTKAFWSLAQANRRTIALLRSGEKASIGELAKSHAKWFEEGK